MSHYMTALAMKQDGLKPAAKIVLYWLADHYNESTGACFPSLNTLSKECEMNRSTLVRHLNDLESKGLIQRTHRVRENGSQTSTEYCLHLVPVAKCNTPCCEMQQPPVAKCDPHNLGNNNLGNEQDIIPASKNDDLFGVVDLTAKTEAALSKKSDAVEILETLGQWASHEAVTSFIAYRKRTRSKALTLTAAKRLATNLKEIFNAGGDTDDALGMAEERGWQTVKPEWYFNTQRGQAGQGSGMAQAFAAVAAREAAKQRGC